mgnify:CR=1 FL=1
MPRKLEKPNIPPDSCNHIDRVVELTESLSAETDEDICSGYNKIINEELELIRTINTQLRQASKIWYDRYYRKRGK